MIYLGHGNPSIWSWSLSNGIPRCLDSEISPPYPESWCAGLFEKTFSENTEELAGVRDNWADYGGWPYPYGDGDSTEVCGECGHWANEAIHGKSFAEKVYVVGKSVLEGAGSLVAGVFRFHSWAEWETGHWVCEVASTSGFRSSEAWIILKSATGSARGYLRRQSFSTPHLLNRRSYHIPEARFSNLHRGIVHSPHFDLHCHTKYSGDNYLEPEELIKQALGKNLDGVCITEHSSLLDPWVIEKNKDSRGLLGLQRCWAINKSWASPYIWVKRRYLGLIV